MWDEFVLKADGHPLQLWGWGEVKASHGWKAERYIFHQDAGAQVLIRILPWPLKAFGYIPRGPVGKWKPNDLEELADHLKKTHGAVCLSMEPDTEELEAMKGWSKASNTILIGRTLILDLAKTDDELLADMSKKTRQYVRKSEREGIEVREAKSHDDIRTCLGIYHQTAARAGFALHGDDYYLDIFDSLGRDHSPVFMAYQKGKPLAFVWLAASQTTSFELYGGMTEEGQRMRANYTLKWYAIQAMKHRGIKRYDMNGLLNDGISVFKKSFASHETMLVGTYDYPLSPFYAIWNTFLPGAKKLVRLIQSFKK